MFLIVFFISLITHANLSIDQYTREKIKAAEENLKKGAFTFDDYLMQIRQMKKMGGMEGVLSLLPGVGKVKEQMQNANLDEKILTANEAIILVILTPRRPFTQTSFKIAKKLSIIDT